MNEPSKHAQYCPFCQRHIEPERDDFGVVMTHEGGFIYVHDEVLHDDDYTFTPLN